LKSQIDLNSWSDFYEHVEGLTSVAADSVGGLRSAILFRGQASYGWPLQTTLERYAPKVKSVLAYSRLISAAKTQIETFTNKTWPEIDQKKLTEFCQNYDSMTFEGLPSYELASYMRHQGFPSPLLDWTRSPYVAAFFAFQSPASERIAIWTYQEYAGGGKSWMSDQPRIKCMGPNVRSDPRHFLQQGEYTLALNFVAGEWQFVEHSSVFQNAGDKTDYLTKITLPATERDSFMHHLNLVNINPYSLFQSEESLMQTVATRLFKKHLA
jgi:hypothetical protein